MVMESLQSNLFEAAAKGCVDSLQQLLIYDPLILERCFVNRFNETPLHVAAMLGHIEFVNKIIKTMPQLVNELNLQKRSPLHLAAARGHVEVVKALLSVDDRVTCLARDSNGLAPVHLAAMKGRDEALKLLLEAQPDAARMVVYEDEETILHLCVKNNQIEALKLILATVNDAEFVNSKDVHGNTALHLAVANKQVKTTKFLVSMGATGSTVEVNAQNQDGGASDVASSDSMINNRAGSSHRRHDDEEYVRSYRDAIIVVATLVASMIYQVGANPPGGVWQEDNFLMDSQGNYVDPQGRRVSTPVDSHNNTVLLPHQAGQSVLAQKDLQAFNFFCINNALGFYSALGIIFIFVAGFRPTNNVLLLIMALCGGVAFSCIADSYSNAVKAVSPKNLPASRATDILLRCLRVYAAVLYFFAFCYYVKSRRKSAVENIRKRLRKWRRQDSREEQELITTRYSGSGSPETETGTGTGRILTSVTRSAVV